MAHLPAEWASRAGAVGCFTRRIPDPLTGNLLREHLRQQRGRHRIKDEDRPSKTPLSTRLLLARCEKAGRHIGAFCQGLHRNHGEVAVRRILGVLSMAKKYGVASAEDACAVALETGATEYHFVRRYLEHSPQLPLNLRQVDPLIRCVWQVHLAHFGGLIWPTLSC